MKKFHLYFQKINEYKLLKIDNLSKFNINL